MKQKKSNKFIVSAILLFFANVFLFLTVWLLNQYDNICFDQFIYQLKSSTQGTDSTLVVSGFVYMGGFGGLLTAFEIFVYSMLSGKILLKEKYKQSKICAFFNKGAVPIAATLLVGSLALFVYKMDIVPYIITSNTDSQFIEENYTDPQEVNITFPENKRNLIFIFAESMENTYAEQFEENYIPELCELAKENTSFSNDKNMGGAYAFDGTTWTASAMICATSGLPVKVSLTTDAYSGKNGFMNGAVTVGDILNQNGYNQVVLMGSDSRFASKDVYFKKHGNYKILDVNSLKKDGRLPEDYSEWWGFEDQKLFEFAKQEVTRLSKESEPFNLTVLTSDTHFPDGYVCEDCEETYSQQYSNVLKCSSERITEFVNWVKEQPFYQDTAIVIIGDHLTMDPEFMKDVDDGYVRTTYNCIINPAAESKNKTNREFATFDIYPTTLAAMGAEIEGDRLGLGTNLFSNTETLTEEYGYEYLNKELAKKSDFYNEKILSKE